MKRDDLVLDILERLARIDPPVAPEVRDALEEGIRADWGGARPYISKASASVKAKRAEQAIRAHAQGTTYGAIAESMGISRQTVWLLLSRRWSPE